MSRLAIARLEARYLVPQGHPRLEAVAMRLDDAAQRLAAGLADCLSPLIDDSDGIWLLRRIELDLALDAAADRDAIVMLWSRAIARAALRRLNAAADGVVYFAGPAAYLASFLGDLASGDAWSLWYYGAFAGLRSLPTPMALRTAILAECDIGRRALTLLSAPAGAAVIDALGATEARHTLDGLAAGGSDETPPEANLLAAWRQVPGLGLCVDCLALALWLALARDTAAPPGAVARDLVRSLAALKVALTTVGAPIAEALVHGRVAGLILAAGPSLGAQLAPLLRLPAGARETLAALPEPQGVETPLHVTRFGGLFLLLPHLGEAPLDALPELPAVEGGEPTALLRLLVLAACAGPAAAIEVFVDPLWRALFKLPNSRLIPAEILANLGEGDADPLVLDGMPDRLKAPLAAAAGGVLRRFARRLPGFADSSAAFLRKNFLACRAELEFLPDRIEVRLAKPPLDVVLSMTGMTRATLDLPWLDARPLVLA